MKKVLLAALALVCPLLCNAEIKYVNANQFPIYGKIQDQGQKDETRYQRIPAEILEYSRDGLKWLGSNSAGLYVRFRTNSTTIKARWSTKWATTMSHMTDTGVRGVDLYVLTDKGWKFLGVGRADEKESSTEKEIVGYMDKKDREYMMYLPLYETLVSLEIGVDEGAFIEPSGLDSPRRDKQVVMYGTSILQGGCANRPGMAFTNILSRKLDREVVNLGFSGNAYLDLEIARFMASAENPAIYVLDYCPNATSEDIEARGEKFVKILRDAHPDVPILIIDEVYYSYYGYNTAVTSTMEKKFDVQKALVQKLRAQGYKKIYHMERKHALGLDDEGFVDGCHYTDLGMMRYAEYLYPLIKKYMLK